MPLACSVVVSDYKKTIKLAWTVMATGSPSSAWVSTFNPSTLQYRSATIHLEKRTPLLVGGAQDVVRVLGGSKPHRTAGNFEKEFSLIIDPAQTNELAVSIRAAEAACFAKSDEVPPVVPAVQKYMYLTHDQDWRVWATDVHTQLQCDAQVEVDSVFPLRMPAEVITPSEDVGESAHVL